MESVRTPELLAPAGSLDVLLAAVAAGVDAVYAGLGAFNARAGNAGLSLDELAAGCAVAHARGVRVYVALNVYVYDAELDDAVALASAALGAGADALIVADAGLCLRLREALPGAELHLSTQAGVQCADAVEFAAHELGVERVTCARELSVAELAELCATGVPIEAFCHGAICICYSGACSYSALLRGRSANRGDCTQPCRLAYELQDAAGRVLAGGAWERGAPGRPGFEGDRLLCPRDYLGIRHIPALLKAGVASFKIEGRMKGPDYVYNVVRCYRAALDVACAGRELSAEELDALEAQLARSFSRGFTDGYLLGGHAATGASHMSFERAINQGLPVGELVSLGYDEVTVGLTRSVAAGDQLEIHSTPGPDAPADVPKRWPIVVCPRDAQAGERLTVHCKRKVVLGSAVHVVRSAGVIEEAAAAVAALRAEHGLEAEPPTASTRRACTHVRRTSEVSSHFSPVLEAKMTENCCSASEGEHDVPERESGVPEGVREVPGGAFEGEERSARDLGEVCRASDVGAVRHAVAAAAPLVCRNLGQVALACRGSAPWEAASPISAWNARTACWLLGLGAQRVWLPEELSVDAVNAIYHEVERLSGAEAAARLVRPTPGSTPLMITEHCLLTAEGPCSNTCATCPRREAANNGDRYLVELDRNAGGHRLRVEVDEHGRTRLYR